MTTIENYEFFEANKSNLEIWKRDGNSTLLKSPELTVGLINNGATCYLNATLQCLLNTKLFQKLLLDSYESNKNSVFCKELVNLLSSIKFSENSAVTTKALLESFGWSKSQIHEQHDAHEFLGLLLEALGKTSASAEEEISRVMQGLEVDILTCPTCGNTKSNESNFRSISLEVPDLLEGNQYDGNDCPDLLSLLKNIVRPETLDENNMWDCESCRAKVCASKQHSFKELPSLIAMHLKRFRFDPISKKRRKLATPIKLNEKVTFSEIFSLPSDQSGEYQVSGIVVHLGNAMGGHYKAFIRSPDNGNIWWECDDEKISILTEKDVSSLFETSASVEETDRVSKLALENTYMVFYSKIPISSQEVVIPLTEDVVSQNERFHTILKLEDIRKHLVNYEVNMVKVNSHESLYISRTMTSLTSVSIKELTQKIYDQFTKNGILNPESYPIENCRIIKLFPFKSGKGESFGERENESLASLGFGENEKLMLEIRSPSDDQFVETNPNDMYLQIYQWNISGIAQLQAESEWQTILVPGREKATVFDMKKAVAESLTMDIDSISAILFENGIPLTLLSDDSVSLRSQHNIFPGFHIVIELKAEESKALEELKLLRNRVRLFVNNPFSSTEQNYNTEIIATSESTLLQVKEMISTKLNIAGLDTFHLKSNESSPQFKEENKTLHELEITDQSILHVQLGKGCNMGEHMLRFEFDLGVKPQSETQESNEDDIKKSRENRYILLDEIPISEKSTILQIKKTLHGQWNQLLEKLQKRLETLKISIDLPNPPSPHHIRLRDLKGGKVSGPLRDERIVNRCLLGIADGRRIAVQVLPNEEIIGPDDLLIIVRVASYDNKTLSEPLDFNIPRTFTLENLYDKLEKNCFHLIETNGIPQEGGNQIEIAKGYTTGPALTLKATLKLKWNEAVLTDESKSILVDKTILNLRDGSIIVVRGKEDWQRAEVRIKARQAQLEAEEANMQLGVGGGASAVRAKSRGGVRAKSRGGVRGRPLNNARGSSLLSGCSSEPVLKLMTDEARPPRPDSSPNENREVNTDLPHPSPNK